MLKLGKKKHWTVGLIVTVVTFILFFVGVKFVLVSNVDLKNIVFYFAFSVVLGLISGALVFWKFKIASWGLFMGLGIGFFEMYRAFFNRMSGWGDLVGIFSLFAFIIMGLGAGIIGQFVYFIYKKSTK